MKAAKSSSAFQWGAKVFSDREALVEILAIGYFREGPAWGSVRCGWAEVVPWREVASLLAQGSRSRMVARTHAMSNIALPRSVPEAVRSSSGDAEGGMLWVNAAPGSFIPAADLIWARCESWLIGGAAKAPAKPKKAPKQAASSKGRL